VAAPIIGCGHTSLIGPYKKRGVFRKGTNREKQKSGAAISETIDP
jgi:hypothetical protein